MSEGASETLTPPAGGISISYLYGTLPVLVLGSDEEGNNYVVQLGAPEKHGADSDITSEFTPPPPEEQQAKSDQERIAALEAQLAQLNKPQEQPSEEAPPA